MRRTTITLLAGLVTLPALVLGVGFCFHTSYDAAVLGKYSPRWFAFLCVWLLGVVPLSFGFGRFLFRTQRIKLSGGRTAAVRPRLKILVLLVAGLLAYLGGSAYVRGLIASRTATIRADAFHPYLQNVPNPDAGKLDINTAGFRGREIKRAKGRRTFRIFVFGGSTVLCGSQWTRDTHCGLLEQKLKATYPDARIEVQNAGADWHSSQHSVMKLLFSAQDYDPDLVIVYHAVNDLIRGFVPDEFGEGEYRSDYRHYYGPVTNLVDPARARSMLWRMYLGGWFSDFRYETVPVRGPTGRGINGIRVMYFPKARPVEIDAWPSLEAFERNMRSFVDIARAPGTEVVVASQPYLYRNDLTEAERRIIWFPACQQQDGTKPSIASMIEGMDLFNATAARVAGERGVGFVDLEAMVPKTLDYFYDDVHYTKAANELIATALHDHVVDRDLVTRTLAARRKTAGR